jgi:hypothetical protein
MGFNSALKELNLPTDHLFLHLERITRYFCWFASFVHRCRIYLMCLLLSLRIIFIADFQLSVFLWSYFLHWMSTAGMNFTVLTTCFELSHLNTNNCPQRRGTARTLPNFHVVLFICMLFYVFLYCSMYFRVVLCIFLCCSMYFCVVICIFCVF